MTQTLTVFAEGANNMRAEIKPGPDNGYVIEYYDNSGSIFKTQTFKTQDFDYIRTIAEEWARSVNILRG